MIYFNSESRQFSIFTKIGQSIQRRTMQKAANKAISISAKTIMEQKAKADARRDMLDKGYTPASKEYNKAVKNAGKDGRESGASIAKMANGLGAGRMIGSSINRMINKR